MTGWLPPTLKLRRTGMRGALDHNGYAFYGHQLESSRKGPSPLCRPCHHLRRLEFRLPSPLGQGELRRPLRIRLFVDCHGLAHHVSDACCFREWLLAYVADLTRRSHHLRSLVVSHPLHHERSAVVLENNSHTTLRPRCLDCRVRVAGTTDVPFPRLE